MSLESPKQKDRSWGALENSLRNMAHCVFFNRYIPKAKAMLLLGAWQEETCLWSKYSLHLEGFWSLLHLR